MIEINGDGSMVGRTFSGPDYKGGIPTPNYGKETYREFYNRCNALKAQGLHLGDLTNVNWYIYCQGSPYNEDCMQDDIIN